MRDRDLMVGVLATQAGFATPAQVIAAAAGLSEDGSESLLTRLELSGALDGNRRKLIEALVESAIMAKAGTARAVNAAPGTSPALHSTLGSAGAAARAPDVASADALEVPPERPGQYLRLREVGRGSQSVVRAARDQIIGREVALKELSPVADQSPDSGSARAARARFLREVRLVASLEHPGIVAIHELARREDGTLFCAQKLIRGETLHERLARTRSLADRLHLLRHVVDACQAVAYAHDNCIIHRDLKPSNVMVGEFGETVVVDWGLAKLREENEDEVPLLNGRASRDPALSLAGVALGTPSYMSPEQARGDVAAIDERSDVFSLGAILYELLTGRAPFEGGTATEVLELVRTGSFPPVRALVPEAPAELAAIAERALLAEPAGRYANGEALAKELSAYVSGGRVRAYQYGTWELLRKFAAGHRALTAGLAVALSALLVSAVVVGFRLQVTRRDLARSFIERAHAAERESDWSLAAAYFAAARAQHDTLEARWGVALAEERVIERTLSLHGLPDSFTDVGTLGDGRGIVLSAAANRVEVRELEGGRALWSRTFERVAAAALLPGNQVRISLPGGWAFFDATTGRRLAMFDRETVGRPCPGPSPAPVVVFRGQLIARREGRPPATLATDVAATDPWCAVSDDGQLVGYRDSTERVHLLSIDDGRELGQRAGTGFRYLLFSRHGLLVIRRGWLETLGAPEGDFTVALGEPGLATSAVLLGGAVVSPDGHLVVVARIGSSRADVVDLRTQSIRGSLHYPPTWPRFAFSLDGQRVLAAGLGRASQLAAWRLPPDESPIGHPGQWLPVTAAFSPTGRQLAGVNSTTPTFELFGPTGELIARDAAAKGLTGGVFARDGLVLLTSEGTDDVTLRDVENHRDVWSRRCRNCEAELSSDGSRAALFGLDGLEVWDAASNRVLFSETARVSGANLTGVALSPDGQRVAWTELAAAHVRDLATGDERQLPMDGAVGRLRFNSESTQVAVVTAGTLSLWDAKTGRAIWSVRNQTFDSPNELRWSLDGRSLLVFYMGLGTELFDARDGGRLARFPSSVGTVSMVRPDVHVKAVMSSTHWDFRPLPQPVDDSPAENLARTLRKTGLALEGVEVVAAP